MIGGSLCPISFNGLVGAGGREECEEEGRKKERKKVSTWDRGSIRDSWIGGGKEKGERGKEIRGRKKAEEERGKEGRRKEGGRGREI